MNESNFDEKNEHTNIEAEDDNNQLQQINAALRDFMETLPPPIVLQQYNSILPNTSDRILAMAEREQEHRHKMREKLIDVQISDIKQERYERRLEQIFGFSLGVVSMVAGAIIAIWKSPLAGSCICSTGIFSVVFIFLLSRKKQQKNIFISDVKNPPILDKIDLIK
ncbi:conserved hypothetical protein [Trichormus variabilis ATCC 29413]|uniref:DUF2335 domain-containing protein n=3 Tax=Anabaena variabilis TaxID=264691 RepID=Q3MFD4_TRIV2|nr:MULTISPECIES: DUF2335 domain-containing protein [Nostocaceae]MBC1258871.1 DUF2335 domain-containing protein [Trichormus variabilis V5]ABA20302.1 conserved hypothetical protein [Trichormus variabilis ATCC 29413]MBC1212721.1 DUF2335 domain-containing protein [Trichormus variabilis ARAD]MBC1265822.1 DUF2335 domain-containing protein [Trichormus variabilis FSR]MBC1300633.1 DUF2335 domain-containing protein [Trichormus variabilis N2B]